MGKKTVVCKYCLVPMCFSSTVLTPEKSFFTIPNGRMRKIWLRICRREDLALATRERICEDHFNLEEDLKNYYQFRIAKAKAIFKSHVVPTKFPCQGVQTIKTDGTHKIWRRQLIKKLETDTRMDQLDSTEFKINHNVNNDVLLLDSPKDDCNTSFYFESVDLTSARGLNDDIPSPAVSGADDVDPLCEDPLATTVNASDKRSTNCIHDSQHQVIGAYNVKMEPSNDPAILVNYESLNKNSSNDASRWIDTEPQTKEENTTEIPLNNFKLESIFETHEEDISQCSLEGDTIESHESLNSLSPGNLQHLTLCSTAHLHTMSTENVRHSTPSVQGREEREEIADQQSAANNDCSKMKSWLFFGNNSMASHEQITGDIHTPDQNFIFGYSKDSMTKSKTSTNVVRDEPCSSSRSSRDSMTIIESKTSTNFVCDEPCSSSRSSHNSRTVAPSYSPQIYVVKTTANVQRPYNAVFLINSDDIISKNITQKEGPKTSSKNVIERKEKLKPTIFKKTDTEVNMKNYDVSMIKRPREVTSCEIKSTNAVKHAYLNKKTRKLKKLSTSTDQNSSNSCNGSNKTTTTFEQHSEMKQPETNKTVGVECQIKEHKIEDNKQEASKKELKESNTLKTEDKGRKSRKQKLETKEDFFRDDDVCVSCPECRRTFFKDKDYRMHYQVLSGKIWKCHVCNEICANHCEQTKHYVFHANVENKNFCALSISDFQNTNKMLLLQYVNLFNSKYRGLFYCVCNFFTSKRDTLKKHIESKYDECRLKAIESDYVEPKRKCYNMYWSDDVKKVTQIKPSFPEVKTLPKCLICGLEFYNRYDYLKHIRFSHTVSRYRCDLCLREVLTKHAIIRHLKKHQRCNDTTIVLKPVSQIEQPKTEDTLGIDYQIEKLRSKENLSKEHEESSNLKTEDKGRESYRQEFKTENEFLRNDDFYTSWQTNEMNSMNPIEHTYLKEKTKKLEEFSSSTGKNSLNSRNGSNETMNTFEKHSEIKQPEINKAIGVECQIKEHKIEDNIRKASKNELKASDNWKIEDKGRKSRKQKLETKEEFLRDDDVYVSCPECRRMFLQEEDYRKHRQVSGEKIWKCYVCNEICANQCERTKHYVFHANVENKNFCALSISDFQNTNKMLLLQYVNLFNSNHKGLFYCVCNFFTPKRDNLKKHIESNYDDCRLIASKSNYRKPERKCYNSGKKVTLRKPSLPEVKALLKCSVCGFEFFNRYDYLEHKRFSHINEYRCDLCLREVSTKRALKTHIEKHVQSMSPR